MCTNPLILEHRTALRVRRRALAIAVCSGVAMGCTASRTIVTGTSPVSESRYVETRGNRNVGIAGAVDAFAAADVVFFGEQHDDPATHRAELALFAALGSRATTVVLSLEMFERDVQPVLDAYLGGQMTETEFLAKSRPWERYTTDYRALVELARARGWRVIAANVPRRFATAVSHSGLHWLDSLSATERAQAAKDVSCPRDRYFDRFAEEMKQHSAGGGPGAAADSASAAAMTTRFYEAQCLKDETMAESIVTALNAAGPGAVVFHVTGAFHTDLGLGTTARVRRRLPNVRALVVSAVPVDDPVHVDVGRYRERGDYLVLTRSVAQPKP